jgi:hypothetical protein
MVRIGALSRNRRRLLIASLVLIVSLAGCARHVVLEREASAGLNADAWTIHSEPEDR